MFLREQKHLCSVCWKMPECFEKGIAEKTACDHFEPISLDDLVGRDESMNQSLAGKCPKCRSANIHDCDSPLEAGVEDPTIGYCVDCETYWCLECGRILDTNELKSECQHWMICNQCPNYEESGCKYTGNLAECPSIRAFLDKK